MLFMALRRKSSEDTFCRHAQAENPVVKELQKKMVIFVKKRRKSLFLVYQLKSRLFGTAFCHVATRVSGCKNQ